MCLLPSAFIILFIFIHIHVDYIIWSLYARIWRREPEKKQFYLYSFRVFFLSGIYIFDDGFFFVLLCSMFFCAFSVCA